jgi:hypothetical protein
MFSTSGTTVPGHSPGNISSAETRGTNWGLCFLKLKVDDPTFLREEDSHISENVESGSGFGVRRQTQDFSVQ